MTIETPNDIDSVPSQFCFYKQTCETIHLNIYLQCTPLINSRLFLLFVPRDYRVLNKCVLSALKLRAVKYIYQEGLV